MDGEDEGAQLPLSTDPADILLMGSMKKKSRTFGMWLARYAVLTESHIIYYRSAKAARTEIDAAAVAGIDLVEQEPLTRLGNIPLLDEEAEGAEGEALPADVTLQANADAPKGSPEAAANMPGPTPHVWCLTTAKRPHLFASPSRLALESWVKAIGAVLGADVGPILRPDGEGYGEGYGEGEGASYGRGYDEGSGQSYGEGGSVGMDGGSVTMSGGSGRRAPPAAGPAGGRRRSPGASASGSVVSSGGGSASYRRPGRPAPSGTRRAPQAGGTSGYRYPVASVPEYEDGEDEDELEAGEGYEYVDEGAGAGGERGYYEGHRAGSAPATRSGAATSTGVASGAQWSSASRSQSASRSYTHSQATVTFADDPRGVAMSRGAGDSYGQAQPGSGRPASALAAAPVSRGASGGSRTRY